MTVRRFRIAFISLVAVLFLGSANFGAQQTEPWVTPVFGFLSPGATGAELRTAHALLRKLAHLTEYAVLAVLWIRAVHSIARTSLRTASWAALLICVACAFVDEAHQSTLPNRTGSASDMVLDSIGALAPVMLAGYQRSARSRNGAQGGGLIGPRRIGSSTQGIRDSRGGHQRR